MSNKLAKALKHKTDAMLRLQGQTQKPVVVEAVDGSFSAPDKADYTAVLAAGKNIQILVSGNTKTLHAFMNLLAGNNISVTAPDPATGAVTISGTISGKGINIADFAGKNGYVLTYNSTTDQFELALAAGSYTLLQATESTLGGIKAKAKTTETTEVAIDQGTGKLYVPGAEAAANGLPAGGIAGQLLSKVDGTNFNANWINAPTGGSELIVYSPGGSIIDDFEGATRVFGGTAVGWSTVAGGAGGSAKKFSTGYTSSPASRTYTIIFNSPAAGKIKLKYYVTTQSADITYNYGRITINGVTKLNTRSAAAWSDFEADLIAGQNTIIFTAYSYASSFKTDFAIDNLELPADGTYGMDAVFNNPDKLLLSSVDGNTIGFLPKTYFMESLSGAALPTAAVAYRGKIFTLLGAAGVADAAYICLKNAADTYAWIAI